jgi:hypothetical protein
MQILPAAQNGVASTGSGRRTTGAGVFSLDSTQAPKSASATGAALGIPLQGVEDATERRRRLAKRGSSALELLDT